MSGPQSPKLIKHSTIYAIGVMSRQLVSIVMLPVYTRFMTPADYGVVGLLTFTLALLEPLVGARLGEAIPKFYFDEQSDAHHRKVFSAAFAITGGVSGISALLILTCRAEASELLFGTSRYALAVGIFGFQILTQAIEYYGLTFIRIQQRPYLFIWVSLTKLVLQLGLNIWLIAFLKLGVLGVVISGGISSAIYATGLSIYILRRIGFQLDLGLARKMLAFSWPLWFSGLAGLYVWQSNRYYIRIFGTLDQVGLFELALKFAALLQMLVWNPFAQVWDIERFSIYQRPNAAEIFKGVLRAITVLLASAVLGLSLFASPVIELMSAPAFHPATRSIPLVSVASAFAALAMFLNFSFLISNRTRNISWNTYAAVVGVTLLNFALIPRYGEFGAAIALTGAFFLQFVLTERIARKYFDMHFDYKLLAILIVLGLVAYGVTSQFAEDLSIVSSLFLRLCLFAAFLATVVWILLRDQADRRNLMRLVNPIVVRLGFQAR